MRARRGLLRPGPRRPLRRLRHPGARGDAAARTGGRRRGRAQPRLPGRLPQRARPRRAGRGPGPAGGPRDAAAGPYASRRALARRCARSPRRPWPPPPTATGPPTPRPTGPSTARCSRSTATPSWSPSPTSCTGAPSGRQPAAPGRTRRNCSPTPPSTPCCSTRWSRRPVHRRVPGTRALLRRVPGVSQAAPSSPIRSASHTGTPPSGRNSRVASARNRVASGSGSTSASETSAGGMPIR